jgi:uncharacterized protein YegL
MLESHTHNSRLGSHRRLPIYLVLDCSQSMAGEPVAAVRNGVTALVADLKTDSQALETAWISVIVFASDAWQSVPLTELVSFPSIFPIVDSADESALGAALIILDRAIDSELTRRTAVKLGDYCPLVVILIDGMPSDDWESAARLLLQRHKLGGMCLLATGPQLSASKLVASVPGIVGADLSNSQPDLLKSFFTWLDQDHIGG